MSQKTIDEILGELQLEACNHAIGSPTAKTIPAARAETKQAIEAIIQERERLVGERRFAEFLEIIARVCYDNNGSIALSNESALDINRPFEISQYTAPDGKIVYRLVKYQPKEDK